MLYIGLLIAYTVVLIYLIIATYNMVVKNELCATKKWVRASLLMLFLAVYVIPNSY